MRVSEYENNRCDSLGYLLAFGMAHGVVLILRWAHFFIEPLLLLSEEGSDKV